MMTDIEKDIAASLLLQVEKQGNFIRELKKHNLSLEEHLLRTDRAWKFMVAAWILLTAFTTYNWFK